MRDRLGQGKLLPSVDRSLLGAPQDPLKGAARGGVGLPSLLSLLPLRRRDQAVTARFSAPPSVDAAVPHPLKGENDGSDHPHRPRAPRRARLGHARPRRRRYSAVGARQPGRSVSGFTCRARRVLDREDPSFVRPPTSPAASGAHSRSRRGSASARTVRAPDSRTATRVHAVSRRTIRVRTRVLVLGQVRSGVIPERWHNPPLPTLDVTKSAHHCRDLSRGSSSRAASCRPGQARL